MSLILDGHLVLNDFGLKLAQKLNINIFLNICIQEIFPKMMTDN